MISSQILFLLDVNPLEAMNTSHQDLSFPESHMEANKMQMCRIN